MAGARGIPVIIVTPPPDHGPTSTVSILTTRNWGLWADGALRKLDPTNARGQNYSIKPDDDIELVELLPPGNDPTAGKSSTESAVGHVADGNHRQIEAHDRPFATALVNKGSPERYQGTKERERDRTKEASKKQFVSTNSDHAAVSESCRLIFCKKYLAVLESIKIRSEMMRAFEHEYNEPWFNANESEDDLPPFLPPTKHIRMKAEELLKDFAENPIGDIKDLLEAKRRRKTTACKALNEILETQGEENNRRPLFESVTAMVAVGG